MEHTHYLLGFWMLAGLSAGACAQSVDPDPDNVIIDPNAKDGSAEGSVVDAATIDAKVNTLPTETLGDGIVSGDIARFNEAPGNDAPFLFDPPSGAILPGGFPSPELLLHTPDLPELVRLEVEVGGQKTAHTAAPVPAIPSEPQTGSANTWWTIRLPKSTWQLIEKMGQVELKFRVLWIAPGKSGPSGVHSGQMTRLGDGFAPDMTYWSIEQGTSQTGLIQRLSVSSASADTLVKASPGKCVGCHTTSPDGKDLIYQAGGGNWTIDIVRPTPTGPKKSPFVSSALESLLASAQAATPTTSAAAWDDSAGRWLGFVGKKVGDDGLTACDPYWLAATQADAAVPTISSPKRPSGLWGALPVWSPTTGRIVFVATDCVDDGRVGDGAKLADLWQADVQVLPDQPAVFSEVTPLVQSPEGEAFPDISHDGKLVAFMRAPAGARLYDQEQGEIYVMNADGSGSPLRLDANDAPVNPQTFAGGLTNSWPRFGRSSVKLAGGGELYFLVFSSRRGDGQVLWKDVVWGGSRPVSFLYLTVVERTNSGTLKSHPAVRVPGQNPRFGAHTSSFVSVTSVPPPPPR
jgi:hypothetical protein